MTSHPRLHLAVIGDGPEAERWACALRPSARTRSAPEALPDGLDGVVVTRGAGDPFARAKEALSAGLHLLCAAPFALTPWQVATLDELARREGRLLRFAEPFQRLPGFDFLRRLLAGEEALWHPLYLRATSLARRSDAVLLDELATEQLAACQALWPGAPASVTAAVSRSDEGEAQAVLLIAQYEGGLLLQSTVSLAESASLMRLVAVTPRRSMTLEAGEEAFLLTISEPECNESRAVDAQRAVPQEHRAASAAADRLQAEAAAFAEAVALGDLSEGNAGRWRRIAALWWAARQSMISGATEAVKLPQGPAKTEPPPLRVIQGGGRTARAAPRPPLTVIAN